jgi:hypothetical protein
MASLLTEFRNLKAHVRSLMRPKVSRVFQVPTGMTSEEADELIEAEIQRRAEAGEDSDFAVVPDDFVGDWDKMIAREMGQVESASEWLRGENQFDGMR